MYCCTYRTHLCVPLSSLTCLRRLYDDSLLGGGVKRHPAGHINTQYRFISVVMTVSTL